MALVILAVACVLGVVAWRTSMMNKRLEEYQARREYLEQEIAQEEQRSQELAEYEKYVQTSQFAEEMAKEKLGLVYEGEIVFKPEK